MVSDGCSAGFLSPLLNSLGSGSVYVCCVEHDYAYTGLVTRLEADWSLFLCIGYAGFPLVAVVVGTAVSIFGWLFYKKGKPNDKP